MESQNTKVGRVNLISSFFSENIREKGTSKFIDKVIYDVGTLHGKINPTVFDDIAMNRTSLAMLRYRFTERVTDIDMELYRFTKEVDR